MDNIKLAQQNRRSALRAIVNERIRTAMDDKGLSVAELASEVEMSATTLRRRLSGTGQCFYVSELAFMAVYLDKPLSWIFGAEEVAA